MSLKGKQNLFKTGADELEGGSVWGREGGRTILLAWGPQRSQSDPAVT